MSVPETGLPTFEGLCAKSRAAILEITDRILELVPLKTDSTSYDDGEIERLLNRLAWHLGFWKSYGTRDTAERVVAALGIVAMITSCGTGGQWGSYRDMIVSGFQNINGMALIPDKSRFNPLLLRELYGQIDADLKAFKLRFGARATRE